MWISGGRGEITAFLIDAAAPLLLRKGALGALGGQLDFSRNISTLVRLGIDVPRKVSGNSRYVPSVVAFGKERGLLGN